jgi:tRNA threonylcarbamoyladenosine biosynthesis protein TsaE
MYQVRALSWELYSPHPAIGAYFIAFSLHRLAIGRILKHAQGDATMRGMLHRDVVSAPSLEITSHSVAETIGFGRRLGTLLQAGDLVLLVAPFGAGKTHLTKGIAAAFGVAEDEVNSPSFVLINQYEADRAHGRIPIYHVDLYRIETPDELASIGLDDVIAADSLTIIEWAEHAADWLPHEHLLVTMAIVSENERQIRLIPRGKYYLELVAALRKDLDKT